jgi:DNA-binding MarR family transcriptional regulator
VRPGALVVGSARKGMKTNPFRGREGSSADPESTLDAMKTIRLVGCHVNQSKRCGLICQPSVAMLSAVMSTKLLSPRELRVWHAFLLMGEDVLGRVGRDIAKATGLSGPEFGVLSRLAAIGKGEMRQQTLARVMTWDKSRLSHQLTRMQQRGLIERRSTDRNSVLVVLTKLGREKLESARPIHAESVRRNLLSRLTPEQVDTIVRVSNLLGEED